MMFFQKHKKCTFINEVIEQSQDLAKAFLMVLGNEKACKQVFNISGEKYVTFDGLARACAKVTLTSLY